MPHTRTEKLRILEEVRLWLVAELAEREYVSGRRVVDYLVGQHALGRNACANYVEALRLSGKFGWNGEAFTPLNAQASGNINTIKLETATKSADAI